MPGKYSHSVVLAEYSNRGVISLPPDQVERYQEYAPRQSTQHPSSLRLRGMRSMQTVRQVPRPSSRLLYTPIRDNRTQHTSAHSSPARARTADIEGKLQQGRWTPEDRDFEQFEPFVKAPDALPDALPDRTALTAYQRQNSRTNEVSTFHTSASPEIAKTEFLKPEHSSSRLSLPFQAVNASLTKNSTEAIFTGRSKSRNSAMIREPSFWSRITGPSAPPEPPRPKTGSAVSRNGVDAPKYQASMNNTLELAHYNRKHSSTALDTSMPSKPHGVSAPSSGISPARKVMGPSIYDKSDSIKSQRPSSCGSKYSRTTQIWSPVSTVAAEPDFDGFIDSHEQVDRNFNLSIETSKHSRRSSVNVDLPIQRPESCETVDNMVQTGVPTPGIMRESSVRVGGQGKTDSTAHSPASRNIWFERRPSSTNGGSQSDSERFASTKDVDSPRPLSRSLPDRDWELPEIGESYGISPSIFEDKEGNSNKFSLEFLDLGSSMGQISSGKDVSFDDDAASDLSAALPPPISRFKDEEDEFNANMAKLFGEGSKHTIKEGSKTVGRRGPSRKGFFSKFRLKT